MYERMYEREGLFDVDFRGRRSGFFGVIEPLNRLSYELALGTKTVGVFEGILLMR